MDFCKKTAHNVCKLKRMHNFAAIVGVATPTIAAIMAADGKKANNNYLYQSLSNFVFMKKIYATLLSVTLCTLSSAAASPMFQANIEANSDMKLESPNFNQTIKQSKHISITDIHASAMPAKAPAKAPTTGTWESIGSGTWVEGPMDVFSDIEGGQKWTVTIEANSANSGWYRILPYADPASPLASLVGKADTQNYVYINATNPAKVYLEPYNAFGQFQFYQLVPESQVFGTEYSEYGTLTDNVISFPVNSFAFVNQAGAYMANSTGKFRIVLPGGELKDYDLESYAPFCTEDNKVAVQINRGADIATVKFLTSPGLLSASTGNNPSIIAQNGTVLPNNYTGIEVDASKSLGINSILFVGLDADGNVQATSEAQYFGVADDNDNWKDLGKGTFNESIYSSGYQEFNEETLEVTIQAHKTEAGRYRLVNPYEKSTQIPAANRMSCESHKHYIYINAANPAQVYVEASPLGVDVSGEGAVYSWAARYLAAGYSAENIAKEGMFGKLTDGVITMPDGTLLHAEKLWRNGSFLSAGDNFKVTLPAGFEGGVEGIAADSDANAPVEYYNLQGVRVANPEAGQLVIKRQGSTVTKVIVR